MGLGAYSQIDNLKKIAEDNNIEVPMKDKLCPWRKNCQNGNDGCYSKDPENCVRFLPLGETNLTEIKGIIETPPWG